MKKLVSAVMVFVLIFALSAAACADYGIGNYGIVITRNPYSGTWAEGESAWFEACAQYYSTMEWSFVDPCGNEHPVQEFRKLFPNVTVEGENTTMLTIHNLDSELNDWAVFCSFHSDIDNSSTKWAFIKVVDAVPTYGMNQDNYSTNPYAGQYIGSDSIYKI